MVCGTPDDDPRLTSGVRAPAAARAAVRPDCRPPGLPGAQDSHQHGERVERRVHHDPGHQPTGDADEVAVAEPETPTPATSVRAPASVRTSYACSPANTAVETSAAGQKLVRCISHRSITPRNISSSVTGAMTTASSTSSTTVLAVAACRRTLEASAAARPRVNAAATIPTATRAPNTNPTPVIHGNQSRPRIRSSPTAREGALAPRDRTRECHDRREQHELTDDRDDEAADVSVAVPALWCTPRLATTISASRTTVGPSGTGHGHRPQRRTSSETCASRTVRSSRLGSGCHPWYGGGPVTSGRRAGRSGCHSGRRQQVGRPALLDLAEPPDRERDQPRTARRAPTMP